MYSDTSCASRSLSCVDSNSDIERMDSVSKCSWKRYETVSWFSNNVTVKCFEFAQLSLAFHFSRHMYKTSIFPPGLKIKEFEQG